MYVSRVDKAVWMINEPVKMVYYAITQISRYVDIV